MSGADRQRKLRNRRALGLQCVIVEAPHNVLARLRPIFGPAMPDGQLLLNAARMLPHALEKHRDLRAKVRAAIEDERMQSDLRSALANVTRNAESPENPSVKPEIDGETVTRNATCGRGRDSAGVESKRRKE